MRTRKDRRTRSIDGTCHIPGNGDPSLFRERRKGRDRRLENLPLEERQLLYSEMPCPSVPDKHS